MAQEEQEYLSLADTAADSSTSHSPRDPAGPARDR